MTDFLEVELHSDSGIILYLIHDGKIIIMYMLMALRTQMHKQEKCHGQTGKIMNGYMKSSDSIVVGKKLLTVRQQISYIKQMMHPCVTL